MVFEPERWMTSRNNSVRVGPQFQAVLPEIGGPTEELTSAQGASRRPRRPQRNPREKSEGISGKILPLKRKLQCVDGPPEKSNNESQPNQNGAALASPDIIGHVLMAELPEEWLSKEVSSSSQDVERYQRLCAQTEKHWECKVDDGLGSDANDSGTDASSSYSGDLSDRSPSLEDVAPRGKAYSNDATNEKYATDNIMPSEKNTADESVQRDSDGESGDPASETMPNKV